MKGASHWAKGSREELKRRKRAKRDERRRAKRDGEGPSTREVLEAVEQLKRGVVPGCADAVYEAAKAYLLRQSGVS